MARQKIDGSFPAPDHLIDTPLCSHRRDFEHRFPELVDARNRNRLLMPTCSGVVKLVGRVPAMVQGLDRGRA